VNDTGIVLSGNPPFPRGKKLPGTKSGWFQKATSIRWRRDMGDLAVVEFKNRCDADALLFALGELQEKAAIEVEDSALSVRSKSGEIDVEHSQDFFAQLPTSGALYFGFLGAVIGWILSGGLFGGAFLGLQVGLVAGFAFGTMAGWLSNTGVPDFLIKKLSTEIEPGNVALFLSVRGSLTSERVLEVLRRFGGHLMHTSLAPEDEAVLKKALA
jgi:uncharacterized membrane protein